MTRTVRIWLERVRNRTKVLDPGRPAVGSTAARRLRLTWIGAAILLVIGICPLAAFVAQPGISWGNETVDDFSSGHTRNPDAVVALEGFVANERGLYLRPGTQGTFAYRMAKPVGERVLLQAWIYGRAPAVTSSLSLIDDYGSAALVLSSPQFVGELIPVPASLDKASQIDLVISATNGSLSDALIIDQIVWGIARGTAPAPAPRWPYLFVAGAIGLAAFGSLRGRRAALISMTVGVIVAVTLFSRIEALEQHYLEPLDPDAINYRIYADRFQWWPPWQNGVFSAEFSEREPLYPLVIHAYFDVLGSSDFHLRVVSSSLSVLAVALTLFAARRRLRWPLALAVTAIVAMNQPLINESYRGLRTELEFCALLTLYLVLDRKGPQRNSVTPLIMGASGALLVLTRTFYLPMVLVVITIASLVRYRGVRAIATSVLLTSAVVVVPVIGHRAGLELQDGDPFYDTAVYARWLANVEFFVQARPLPHPELFPEQLDYGRYGPYFGPPITYTEYLFQLHSLPDFITVSAFGYADIFRRSAVFSPPPSFIQATAPAKLSALIDIVLKSASLLGLALLTLSGLRRRRPLDLLLPAFVLGALSFSAFLYRLGLIEQYRNTVQILPLVLIAAGTAVETTFRRFNRERLFTSFGSWLPRLRSCLTTLAPNERWAVSTGLIAGAAGAGLVNFISLSIQGPAGVVATLVAVMVALAAALWRPLWAAWLLLFAVFFPIHLVPYTLTTLVVVATYLGVAARIAYRRDQASGGVALQAVGILALAIVVAAGGAVLAGNAVVSDGGLRIAAAFILLMGIAFSVPQLVRQDGRTTVFFFVALAVGMSVWGVIEYFGKIGVLPITPQAWTNDLLGKAVPGALSSAFVGGGPNTYAAYLAVALVLACAGLRERALAPLAALAALIVCLNLAFTYSRGGEIAGIVGLLWLLVRSGRGTRRPITAVLVLMITSIVVASAVGLLRVGFSSVAGTGDTWRSFVADPSWVIVQELEVPSGVVPDKLFIKLRAAPGDAYQLQVKVDDRVVLLGKAELPSAELQWVEIPLPSDLPANAKLAIVECRLVGTGDQHDRYFEVEGTTKPLPGAHSRFVRGNTVQDQDLSVDPGIQSGSYLIKFGAPEPSPAATESAPTIAAVSARLANAAVAAVKEDERFPIWGAALRSFASHPIFGIGFYSSSVVLRDQSTNIDYANFHNEFLEFLAGSGVVGLIGLLTFFALLGRTLWRNSRAGAEWNHSLELSLEAALVALAIAFLFGSFLVDSRIAGLTWLLAGLVGTYDVRALRWPRQIRRLSRS
jgi:O-Antigen ligase